MSATAELKAAARLDIAEILRSRWLVFNGVTYGLISAFFVLVGLRESMVLGFTGMGRVLFSLCNLLVVVLPLLALTATVHVVNRARDDGTLELLFSLPLRRSTYFAAVSATRFALLVVPLVACMAVLAVVGRVAFGDAVPWDFLVRTLAVSASLLAAFCGIGMLISTVVRNQARAVLYGLFAWAAGAVLLDFGLVGLLLQWQLNAKTVLLLAALNPVQSARIALVTGADPDLSVLGPVGFFISQQLGPALTLALGLGWPAVVGLGAWALAVRRFTRGDLV